VQTEVLNVPVTHSSARFSMRFALARPYRSERRRFDQAPCPVSPTKMSGLLRAAA
jgi:hypothetical protein